MAQFQLKLAGLAGVRETNHYIYDDFLTANQAEAQSLLEKNPPDAILQPWAAGKGRLWSGTPDSSNTLKLMLGFKCPVS